MLNAKLIDLNNYARKEHYLAFKSRIQCYFSTTIKLEVTNLILFCKKYKYKFNAIIIYCIMKEINNISEMKMGWNGKKQLLEWNEIHPLFNIFHENNKTFSSVYCEWNADLKLFYNNYLNILNQYENDLRMNPQKLPVNLAYLSCFPWLKFENTSLDYINIHTFRPAITWCGIYQENQKSYINMMCKIHHAVADGYHISLFFNNLQKFINQLN